MKLADYLDREGMTHADFAAKLGVSRSAVTQWTNAMTLPTGERMVLIHRLSGGAVGLEDWPLPEERGRRVAR
ncbi:helix-turn-helix domain-containing protein [Endothiovibrio diazotrophicus]